MTVAKLSPDDMGDAFRVSREENFELARQKTKSSGVRIHTTSSVDRPSGSGSYFFDSGGNLLQLYAAEINIL
jgi:hypothetical protein